MEFNLNTIKINNKVEIKVLDLIWFIFIPIINVNYYISSMLAKNTHDITGELDGIIKFNSIFIIPYMYWYIYIIIFWRKSIYEKKMVIAYKGCFKKEIYIQK